MLSREPLFPAAIQACMTTRSDGDLGGPSPDTRTFRKHMFHKQIEVPADPVFMQQVHGNGLVVEPINGCVADASVSARPGVVLAVRVADCAPLLIADAAGERVAAVHCGWRGLAADIIRTAVAAFEDPAAAHAWLGPCIGPCHYEVDQVVRDAFTNAEGFEPVRPGHWRMDLRRVARMQLLALGVSAVAMSDECTYCESAKYWSYRRDGTDAGRMAAMIWRR